MKVNYDNISKTLGLGLALYCLFVSNALAISVEPLKFEDLKTTSINATNSLQEDVHRIDKKTNYHSSDALPQHKNFALVDSIKEDGQLFFAMRSDHTLVSESSAAALLLLGFLGFFSRRWS